MNRRTFFTVGALMLLGAAAAQAVDFAKLKERFKQRYPKLLKAKDAGKIGETFHGYVEATPTARPSTRQSPTRKASLPRRSPSVTPSETSRGPNQATT